MAWFIVWVVLWLAISLVSRLLSYTSNILESTIYGMALSMCMVLLIGTNISTMTRFNIVEKEENFAYVNIIIDANNANYFIIDNKANKIAPDKIHISDTTRVTNKYLTQNGILDYFIIDMKQTVLYVNLKDVDEKAIIINNEALATISSFIARKDIL